MHRGLRVGLQNCEEAVSSARPGLPPQPGACLFSGVPQTFPMRTAPVWSQYGRKLAARPAMIPDVQARQGADGPMRNRDDPQPGLFAPVSLRNLARGHQLRIQQMERLAFDPGGSDRQDDASRAGVNLNIRE